MMDGLDDSPDLLADEQEKGRSVTVDLADKSLVVDISDAVSERDKVKFTVHTATTLSKFKESDFCAVRQHEEFIWLHERFIESECYAGYIVTDILQIPPAPPRPNFDQSREKLQRLGEGEGTMTQEEFTKMKQELEAEYLATFKKTVAMHEVFLQRIAAHPVLSKDINFETFLSFADDLAARTKNKKERIGGFIRSLTKTADETLILANQEEVDSFFENEKIFLVEYHNRIKDSTMKCDKMTKSHKNCADCYIQISTSWGQLATIEYTTLNKLFKLFSDTLEKARKLEGRAASDTDLKQADTLRYYMRDSVAAKDLLYRRSRFLANYENANKTLDKARMKNKDVAAAEKSQQECCEKFESISKTAKEELTEFKSRRIKYFKKNLCDHVELQLKHAKAQVQLYKNCIAALKDGV